MYYVYCFLVPPTEMYLSNAEGCLQTNRVPTNLESRGIIGESHHVREYWGSWGNFLGVRET